MAFFAVTIETIGELLPIKDADRIEIARLAGIDFQFVVAKGLRKVGDKVLYFPVESILPDNIVTALGLTGKLTGPGKNRVKTIRLRGAISQGVMGDLSLLDGLDDPNADITTFLGVTKYEPEPEFARPGGYNGLGRLPGELSKYDIEGCERNREAVAELETGEVLITEKVEGTNFSTYIDENDKVWVNQRSFTIEEDYDNTYWKSARDCGIIDFAKALKAKLGAVHIAVWGELAGPGIQKNIYKLKTHKVFGFDIKLNGQWVNAPDKVEYFNAHKVDMAPVLFKGRLVDFLAGRSIKDASNGKSVLLDTQLREGIVINPFVESYSPILKGRLILKQRSPDYLAKEE
jgi:RNA ligase (TIGR02306 family)